MMNTLLFPLLAAVSLCGRTTKELPVYALGEEMVFEISASGAVSNELDGCYFEWKRTGDDGKTESGKTPATDKLIYRTSLDRPGFVRISGELFQADGKPFRQPRRKDGYRARTFLDIGAGVDIGKIRTAVAAPADLRDFWTKRKAEFAKVAWQGQERLKEIASPNPNVALYEFSIPCWGGKPATGFLAVPRKAGKYAANAKFFGYNESWTYSRALKPPAKLADNLLQMWVNPHGVEMGHDEAYYKEFRKTTVSNGYTHGFDPAQNADPEKTYWAGVSARILRALEYLKSRPEWGGRLAVTGGSQGGMQSVWCAALDGAVNDCIISIPWNCDIGGETVGRNRGDWYVKWVPALGYYDTANLGALIPSTCRVKVSMAGLGDYICPPTGVMAFYNALTCPKEIVWKQNSQHGNSLEPHPQQFRIAGEKMEVVK